jgi:hypothetical protein
MPVGIDYPVYDAHFDQGEGNVVGVTFTIVGYWFLTQQQQNALIASIKQAVATAAGSAEVVTVVQGLVNDTF